ncbi:MAG: 3-methyl-2-oxobutanoate dehydrogenase subunit VorB [Fibrobacteres bacterium]|nr:3-methyl-2-oxobutanoate dehydrogenase subunit VorB [Fibrobacterota bacterium]
MSERVLMKGNDAIAESAIRAGLQCYFGYPITPQNELTAYMAKHMPEHGKTFIQAESEVAAVNMVYGAASAGVRTMTSSSSPGMSLKQEGVSYMVGAELPAVLVNIVRGGPGLGNIAPSQADYFQSTKGGGHGDYHLVVYAPATVQEAADLTFKAFDVADKYRNPVLILGDAILGQMMEPLTFKDLKPQQFDKSWAVGGARNGRKANLVNSLSLEDGVVEEWNWKFKAKYEEMKKNELMVETIGTEDADLILVAYGTTSRICKSVMTQARAEGLKVGLIRPITVWPFPYKAIAEAANKTKEFLVVEMSLGQMIEDVKLAVLDKAAISFHGRPGGGIPTEDAVMEIIDHILRKKRSGEITTRGTKIDWQVS